MKCRKTTWAFSFGPHGVVVLLAGLLCATTLTGCGGNFISPTLSAGTPVTSATSIASGPLQGAVHGGQGPIYDAAVFLLQTTSNGYPSTSIPPNPSIIIPSSTGFTGNVDGSNYTGGYVLTDRYGYFSIPTVNCTLNSTVYLVSVGGQPIYGTTNTGAILMAPMGICTVAGVAAITATGFFTINEISTAITAFALSGFTVAGMDPTHISTSSTNVLGLQNAMQTALNLVGGGAGIQYSAATSVAGNANSLINPQTLNTLGNIFADCVNGNGSTSSSTTPCYVLYQNATSNGVTGAAPCPRTWPRRPLTSLTFQAATSPTSTRSLPTITAPSTRRWRRSPMTLR